MSIDRQNNVNVRRNPVAEEIQMPEIMHIHLSSLLSKPKPFAKAARSRAAAMSTNKSRRTALGSIPVDAYAEKILLAVLAEIETLPILGSSLTRGTMPELVQMRDHGIPYRPAGWYGVPLDCAARQAYSRAALRLETHGVLRRITEPCRDRVTHLQLTALGLRLALSRAGHRADRSAIAEGLRLTRWGKDLAANISAGKNHVKDAGGR